MARSGPLSGIVALLLAFGLLAGFPITAAAADEVAFTINDARITESSGLARDQQAGAYWTVNDSGDRGVAYGISPTGKVLGTLNYRAQPEDVEAVAVFEDRLYIADIGDNNEDRDFVTVYYFDNPRASGLTVSYRAWDFAYPDGPHDAETLLVNDKGRLYIVTKGAEGGRLHRAIRSEPRGRQPVAPGRRGPRDGHRRHVPRPGASRSRCSPPAPWRWSTPTSTARWPAPSSPSCGSPSR